MTGRYAEALYFKTEILRKGIYDLKAFE